MLQDEVWRLEKIGKDGAFHKKLATARIHTVQDFLKLSVVDPRRLRGVRMDLPFPFTARQFIHFIVCASKYLEINFVSIT
jgi:hypothetical protein